MEKLKIEIKWSLIFSAMMILWMVGEKLFGLHSENIAKHAFVSGFVAIPAIAIYVMALLEKRRVSYSGIMTYKQAFISGAIITAFVSVLSLVTQLTTSLLISPEYFPNIIKYSVESGTMTQEAAEAYFNLNSYLVQAVIGSAIMGLLTTLIVAAFVRKSS